MEAGLSATKATKIPVTAAEQLPSHQQQQQQ
jgi:hypothetical protein